MQAVAAAAGGGSLQHSSGLQHHAGGPSMQHRGHPMQHSMMATGAQVPAASQVTSGESGQREQGDDVNAECSGPYEAGAGGHYYGEVRREAESGDREMASPGPEDSPTYIHRYTERPEDERETSASGSASCEDEEDERDYDGKRSGDPLSGLAAKKRRKQSKPIRLGSEEEGAEGEAEAAREAEEEGEVIRYRRGSGDSGEAATDSADTPLNLSAVSKHSDMERVEPGGGWSSLMF